jgi:ClpP class serine protease
VDWVVQGALEAPASERAKKVREARWLISMEKEPRDRSWFLGVLFEGLGEVDAIGHYAEAARLGRQDAEPRLVAMLNTTAARFAGAPPKRSRTCGWCARPRRCGRCGAKAAPTTKRLSSGAAATPRLPPRWRSSV